MFEIEIIGLINKYKNSMSDEEKNNYKMLLKKLILENEGSFNSFVNSESIDAETINFLQGLKKDGETESIVYDENSSDLEKIKNSYLSWEKYFSANNNVAENNCENIIVQLVVFYAPNRLGVLKRLFSIKDSEDFESFKIMLKNYLRKYYSEKIEKIYVSAEFEGLGFFEKRKKEQKVLKVVSDLENYIFNEKEILEVLSF